MSLGERRRLQNNATVTDTCHRARVAGRPLTAAPVPVESSGARQILSDAALQPERPRRDLHGYKKAPLHGCDFAHRPWELG
jgi:hypothetical protein